MAAKKKGTQTPAHAAQNPDAPHASETARREEEILAFWKEQKIFEATLTQRAPKGEFVFYDGPPFATGLPHYGSLLSSVIKDVIPRYKTMRGYHVRRVWGWDCHGLPIENMIEKELGLKYKQDILAYGIDNFNEACKQSVLRFADEWERYVDRIGRWVDFKGAYRTMDNDYIESVWWALKKIYDDGKLYEGRKVLLYCPHCETPLSKAEIAMDDSYEEVTEESVYVKCKLKDAEKHGYPEHTYFVAWTTTPWTLPGNVALAVGEEIDYVLVAEHDEYLILAKELHKAVAPTARIEREVKGKDLVGLSYEPVFEIAKVDAEQKENAFTVLPADFVTTEDGTGIVHTAVIYGEDDYHLGLAHDLPMVPLLSASGHFTDDAPAFMHGQYFKDAETSIKDDLEERGLLFKREMHTHSYPHCHRCGTPLIYVALTSWFINIGKIKKRMQETNQFINWVPEHLRDGRYQNILENAPDWTISRNRFWASPLPIWRNEETGKLVVIGSRDELQKRTKVSGNAYLVIRHGQAQSNVGHYISSDINDDNPLTEEGEAQIRRAAQRLKDEELDLIITSPFMRTSQTAAIVREELDLPQEQVVVDARLGEINLGVLNGKPIDAYKETHPTYADRFDSGPEGGESLQDVRRRLGAFLYEIERTYQGKRILLVTHEYAAWGLFGAAAGAGRDELIAMRGEGEDFIGNGEVRVLPFTPLPHNHDFELDLHRPYIDEVELIDTDGTPLTRVPEVIDGWVESGSMPFSQYHYPFENREEFEVSFPGDFIAEYIAQTRTWFYYLHAMSILLFDKASFKNVVTTGTILAEDGSKMSKSKQNFTDPLANLDRYGADAVRFYLMSSPVMAAEDMRFTDEELREAHNRVVNLLWNTTSFYQLYAHFDHAGIDPSDSPSVLDAWILARLNQLTDEVTEAYDRFDTIHATRPLRVFIEDLSTWYVRRSRDRFKGADERDRAFALATTRAVLLRLAQLAAPTMPFIAESVYRAAGGDELSVHLTDWPSAGRVDHDVLDAMLDVRSAVTLGLQARASAGIKVRQPLAQLTLQSDRLRGLTQCIELVKDEVNVKAVHFDPSQEEPVALTTTITPELQAEGDVREVLRHVQQLRKEAGLQPEDRIRLSVATNEAGMALVRAHEALLTGPAGVAELSFVEHGEGVVVATVTAPIAVAIERV
ncbi:class I tRNA ligase family protein [Patescibacteria group bacterium]|jgi:isoleucyl-tRNA synthetase|nr:class I tRNA ligase family protein [Patescibacteria group bacterium]